MKFSIITVSFNSASTLERTLRSVAEQAWQDVEHIIVDGRSSDGTLEIIESYKENIAKIIIEEDDGIYDAMNKGLSVSSGDIICFLNADDYYSSRCVLKKVATEMSKNQLDVVFGDVEYFSSSSPKNAVRRYRSGIFRPGRLAWGFMPAHPALFITRSVVNRVGRFKTDYKIAGDFEYIIRIFEDKKVRYSHISDVLVRMQLGGVSTKSIKSRIQINKEVLRACRENGIKTNLLKICSKYFIKVTELIRW